MKSSVSPHAVLGKSPADGQTGAFPCRVLHKSAGGECPAGDPGPGLQEVRQAQEAPVPAGERGGGGGRGRAGHEHQSPVSV